VPVETNPSFLVHHRGRRFADIVKENAEDQRQGRFRGQHFQHDPRVLEDVAFGMELRRLFAALHRIEFR
jgi:hypothetical protein